MAVARTGAILPNGNFKPQLFSTKLLVKYFSAFVVPHISNHDYDGEISRIGDKVTIRKRPDITIYDGTVNGALQVQNALADDVVTLDITTRKYFNVPIDDIDIYQSDLALMSMLEDQAALALGQEVEQDVLQSIYTSATSTVTATNVTAATILAEILEAELYMNQLNVPNDGRRFLVINPKMAYLLAQSDLKAAYLTGETGTPLRDGAAKVIDRPIAGFNRVYISNNLSVGAAGICHAIAGHMDALCFAAQINNTEVLRSETAFADLLRGQIVYGYKVVKPEALVHIDVQSYA
jgi:hypothetical protein